MTVETEQSATPAPKEAVAVKDVKEPRAEVPEDTTKVVEEDPDLPSKVYAGNLHFETTEEDLHTHFAKFGKIKSATIVRSHDKHLGYGFVTFETVAEAEKAIVELNQSTIRERVISVQSARSRTESAKKRSRRPFRGRRRQRAGKRTSSDAKANEDGEKEPAKDEAAEDPVKKEEGEEPASQGQAKNRGRGRGRLRGRGRGRPNAQGTRQRGPPSTTTVFVANLPFATNDIDLEKAFADKGLQVTSAHVVKGKGRFADKSKGFGFVDLVNEEEQKKAVAAMHGTSIDSRQISVRVALDKVDSTPEGEQQSEGQETADVKQVNGASDGNEESDTGVKGESKESDNAQ